MVCGEGAERSPAAHERLKRPSENRILLVIMKQIAIKESHLLFYISYGIFLSMLILKVSFYFQYFLGTVFNLGVAACVLLLIINELIIGTVNDRGILSIVICVVFIGLFIFTKTIEYKVIVATVLFVFSARDIPFESIAKFSVIISTILLAFVIVSAYLGIIPNYEGMREDTSRFFLGFLYALYPSTIMMNITMLVFYIRKEKILWRELLILLLCNVWLFLKTDSRMPFYIAVITLLIAVFLKWKPQFLVHKKNFTAILALAFVFCAILSILISILYNPHNPALEKLNLLLSTRLELQHKAMTEYGVTLFGQDIHIVGFGLDPFGEMVGQESQYFYLDNLYIMCLVGYGAVLFVLLTGLFTVVSFKSRRADKQGYLLIAFVLLAIISMVQDSLLLLYYNTFLLSIGNLLFGKERKKEQFAVVKPESIT